MRRHVSIRERYLPKVLQLCRNIISVIRARRKPRGTFSTHFHRYHSERRESKKWNAIRNAITAALNCVRLTVSKALLQILFYLALFFSVFVSPLCGIFNFTEELGRVFSLSKKKEQRTETNKKRWKKKKARTSEGILVSQYETQQCYMADEFVQFYQQTEHQLSESWNLWPFPHRNRKLYVRPSMLISLLHSSPERNIMLFHATKQRRRCGHSSQPKRLSFNLECCTE